jgi:hypothetical protein
MPLAEGIEKVVLAVTASVAGFEQREFDRRRARVQRENAPRHQDASDDRAPGEFDAVLLLFRTDSGADGAVEEFDDQVGAPVADQTAAAPTPIAWAPN